MAEAKGKEIKDVEKDLCTELEEVKQQRDQLEQQLQQTQQVLRIIQEGVKRTAEELGSAKLDLHVAHAQIAELQKIMQQEQTDADQPTQ